jgi:hypothetical protein
MMFFRVIQVSTLYHLVSPDRGVTVGNHQIYVEELSKSPLRYEGSKSIKSKKSQKVSFDTSFETHNSAMKRAEHQGFEFLEDQDP